MSPDREAQLRAMFPKSYAAMTGRASTGTQAAAAVSSPSDADEWNAELARLKDAAKNDPGLEDEVRRAFIRAGKEVRTVRGAAGTNTREGELRRMFPNSYERMVAKGGGR